MTELAFSHVESILDSRVAGATPASLGPGQHVELHGLAKAELNGTRGFVIDPPDAKTGRVAVETYFGKKLSVKAANLIAIDDDEEEEGSGDDEEAAMARICDTGE